MLVKKTNGLYTTYPIKLLAADCSRIRVEVRSGKIVMEAVCFEA